MDPNIENLSPEEIKALIASGEIDPLGDYLELMKQHHPDKWARIILAMRIARMKDDYSQLNDLLLKIIREIRAEQRQDIEDELFSVCGDPDTEIPEVDYP